MKSRFGLIALLLTVCVFSAAGQDNDSARSELAAAHSRWISSGITDYEIRFQDVNCYCLFGPYYGPILNVVRSGKLKASYYEGATRDGYRFGRKVRIATVLRATVEDVFLRADRLVDTAPDGTYQIKYDPKYGFPTDINFDDPARDDEQWHLVTDGFKPLKAN